MVTKEIDLAQENEVFDPLDMNNYRIEKLKKNKKVGFEKLMEVWGGPLAILAFIFIYYFADISY